MATVTIPTADKFPDGTTLYDETDWHETSRVVK